MLVLGLNFGDHDPSAALVEDGRLRVAIEHERISRTKRAKFQSPTDSILECLRAIGATPADVDCVAVGWSDSTLREMGERESRFRMENILPGAFRNRPSLPRVIGVRHHLAHAASAFWCSGFADAAVLVVDGEGEDESISLWRGTPEGLTEIERFPPQLSLGHFYKSATKFSGLEAAGGNHEGKLMGLSSYGRVTEPMPLKSDARGPTFVPSIAVESGPRLRQRLRDQLHAYWRLNAYPYADGDGREIMAYANFAASVQNALEEALIQLAERIKRATNSPRLAIAGGVAQNCAANGALAHKGIFEQLYIQPSCHDAGVSFGAALQVCHAGKPGNVTPESSRMTHAYWGTRYSTSECESAVNDVGLKYERVRDDALPSTVASALANGAIVGWFQGRAEIGPRALGARSILADPRKRANLIRVNAIKAREVWRPLAPSVLAEHFDDFFVSTHPSPFMNAACPVRPQLRRLAPAIVHVDGTARPHAVFKQDAPRYWQLIDAFHRITGIPLLLNTSFNLQGEPIVSSPRDAVRDFLLAPIDMLVLEDLVIRKSAQGVP